MYFKGTKRINLLNLIIFTQLNLGFSQSHLLDLAKWYNRQKQTEKNMEQFSSLNLNSSFKTSFML